MTLSHMTKLSSIPKIKMLLLKAALKKSSYNPQQTLLPSLPSNKYYVAELELDGPTYTPYHQVVGWDPESDIIHPCYIHSLAFPLHIMLLLQPDFPFPLLGLVHVNNQVRQLRPIRRQEKLSICSYFGQVELHSKGWLFSIKVECYSGSELVWQSISTNLFRTKHGYKIEPKDKHIADTFVQPSDTTWTLSSSLGRQYAKVSGDYNPIHLAKWSAKLLGFKQHIVHGMWTKAYCIAALHNSTPSLFSQGFEVNVTFRQPLYLPSQVSMAVQPVDSDKVHNGQQHFNVVGIGAGNRRQPLHIIGDIQTI